MVQMCGRGQKLTVPYVSSVKEEVLCCAGASMLSSGGGRRRRRFTSGGWNTRISTGTVLFLQNDSPKAY